MFPLDDSPQRVTATPEATAHLSALAAGTGELTVLLTADGVELLPAGVRAPAGSLKLGELEPAVLVAADDRAHTRWWRTRATLGMAGADVSVELSALTESEVYAAVAAGPLPRL